MYVPSTPPPQTSPRVRELAQRITEVIRSFRQSHPDLALLEIRQAAQIALATIRGEMRGASFDAGRLLPTILGVVVLLLGLVFFYVHQQGNPEQYVTVAVAVLVVVIGLVVAFVARHR